MDKSKIHELNFTGFSEDRVIAMLKAQQEAAIDGILVIDENQSILSFNQTFLSLWEIPEELAREGQDDALLGLVISRIKDPDAFIQKVMYLYEHIEETSRDEIHLKDGKVFDRYSSPIFDGNQKYLGRIWFFRDITDRKQIELELRKQTIRMQEALEETNQINEELQTTLDRVRNQQEKIVEQNDKIMASINYAKRIQQVVFPSTHDIDQLFSDAFVLWKPRDVVSGDFYWFEKIEGKLVIAVADCTGHGVPGAFMSMLGIQALTNIINNDKTAIEPDAILAKLHTITGLALKKGVSNNRDGMEIGICVIDLEQKTMSFAAAGLPLYLVQNGVFSVIKGDRHGIGGLREFQRRSFTKTIISLEQPTTFFLASDGFQDQIGGAEGKKFLTKNLRELLTAISIKPTKEQASILEQTLTDWQGTYRQIDDILVFGACISC